MYNSENGLSAADVAAVTGGNNGFGGFNGDGAWWMLVLFLFAFANGGWGNGGFGGGVSQGDMQRGFDQQSLMNSQASIMQQINAVSMAQQECCCNTREAIANLRYDVATQAANDRAEVAAALQQVLTSNAAGIQSIKDQLCQDKIDAKNEEIANLRTQLNMAALNASQNAQTAQILADNARQTTAIEQYLNPSPIPAYVVQNPNCCANNFGYGCGCGVA